MKPPAEFSGVSGMGQATRRRSPKHVAAGGKNHSCRPTHCDRRRCSRLEATIRPSRGEDRRTSIPCTRAASSQACATTNTALLGDGWAFEPRIDGCRPLYTPAFSAASAASRPWAAARGRVKPVPPVATGAKFDSGACFRPAKGPPFRPSKDEGRVVPASGAPVDQVIRPGAGEPPGRRRTGARRTPIAQKARS
jgi:hypothetical protein